MSNNTFYPNWKKAAIQLWRTFFAAFVVILGAQLEAGVDVANFETWVRSAIGAAILGGVRAVFKFIRETYFAGDYDNDIYKIPLG